MCMTNGKSASANIYEQKKSGQEICTVAQFLGVMCTHSKVMKWGGKKKLEPDIQYNVTECYD